MHPQPSIQESRINLKGIIYDLFFLGFMIFYAMVNQEYYKVVVDDVGITNILQNESFVALKARDLIEALKEIV